MLHHSPITLVKGDNTPINLASLWQERPVLLYFMRQLGCGLCRQQLLRLRAEVARFEAANCAIGIVVMGDGKMAQGLEELYQLPFPVYADATTAAYQAFNIGETSWWNVVGPHIVARQIGTAINGMKPAWGPGSIRQLGGLVILNTDGTLIYRYVADPIYQYPPWDEVLGALSAQTAPVAEQVQ